MSLFLCHFRSKKFNGFIFTQTFFFPCTFYSGLFVAITKAVQITVLQVVSSFFFSISLTCHNNVSSKKILKGDNHAGFKCDHSAFCTPLNQTTFLSSVKSNLRLNYIKYIVWHFTKTPYNLNN